MSNAIAARGTLIVLGSSAIAAVNTINGPQLKSDVVDVTSHSSPGNWREFVPTLKDGGEVAFEINYNPTEPTHRNIVGGLLYAFDAQSLESWSIVYPDAAGTTWRFSAYVTAFAPSMPHDGKISAAVTIKVSGPVSFDVGYTYYIDPVGGSDSNPGTSATSAWKTTTHADATVPTLSAGQSIGYFYSGYWRLYRKPGMSSDEAVLPSDLYTGSSDLFQ